MQLVLHTGHDESSFTDQVKANLEDLVTNTPNLVLILEGQAHLKDITAAIPTIAADYGQPDKTGTPRTRGYGRYAPMQAGKFGCFVKTADGVRKRVRKEG